jgi:dTDP-glucose 4,6-dehydratase
MYKEFIDPTFTYQNFTAEEQAKILKADRSNNALDTTRLEQDFFILPIYQSVQRLFKRARKKMLMENGSHVPLSILVTGGFGFIASNFLHYICNALGVRSNAEGVRIINIDKNSYCSIPQLVDGIPVTSFTIDINETEKILEIMTNYEIDTVVHFAAQSHVDKSFGNSISFTMDNVRGTHSLLEASRRYRNIKKFVHISTDEVYGENLSNDPFTEDQIPNPSNPYAATKISAEFLVQSYFHCFELPIVIVRGNNVYGPRQFPEKLIPKCILRLLEGEKCALHGNGFTRRNFVYVEDMCSAILKVIKEGKIGEIYNIGTKDEKSVIEIATALIYLLKGNDRPVTDIQQYIDYVPDRFYNDFTYRISSEKLHQLGWSPKTNFKDGLRKTVEYYIKNRKMYENVLNEVVTED